MDRPHHEHHRSFKDEYSGYDPVQARWTRPPGFTEAWLKHGESLTLLQRSGYAVLSLFFTASGLFLLWACAIEFRDGSLIFVLIFGGAMFLSLTVGVKGLRNVLRFPPGS
jgi:hypothetical protein